MTEAIETFCESSRSHRAMERCPTIRCCEVDGHSEVELRPGWRWKTDTIRIKQYDSPSALKHFTLSQDAVSLSQQKTGGTTTYPPRMKSTKVCSDSALNDSSVTLTTFIRAERYVKQSIKRDCRNPSTYSSRVDVFLFPSFLFWIKDLQQEIRQEFVTNEQRSERTRSGRAVLPHTH